MKYFGLISTEEWLHSTAKFFDSQIEKNRININPTQGEGYIETLKIEDRLDLVLTDIILNNDTHIHKHGSNNKGIIIKYLIQTPASFLMVRNKDERLRIKNGIYASTSHSFDTNYIKAGDQFQVLSFILAFEWIEKHQDNQSFILNNNTITRPFFIFENINPTILQLAKNVFNINKSDLPYKQLLLNSSAIELLAKTFSLFDYRKDSSLKEVIKNQQDIDVLFEVRKKLTSDFENGCPSIQSLSEEFGISPTKLKTNFKTFFGKPIFQYFQQERMELAKSLIENGNLSISEVGIKVGYNNLSKFSSTYRKQFGFLPKETMQ
ncbi:AraC family transcriptional regulator [Bacteroidales bacterium OttesenSCG-928-C19]|nr:AraC family transcriptional regulator [Bacteroidales bacterium OttesenSCG-928-C19]